MKAVATTFLLAFLFVIAIIIIIFAIGLPTGKTEIKIVQEELYTLQNALDAAKNYLLTAAKYSTYQAYYDVLKSGPLTEEQFIANIEGNITENMNVYTSDNYKFLDGYEVQLPQYMAKIVRKENEILLLLIPDKNLTITKNYPIQPISSDVQLEKKSEIILNMTNNFNFAAQSIAYVNNIKLNLEILFNQKINSLSEYSPLLPKTIDERFEQAGVTCESAFEIKTGRNFESIESEVKDFLENFLKADSNVKVRNVDVKIIPTIIMGEGAEDYTVIKCNYEYRANFDIDIILLNQEKYPVWNGTEIAFEPLKAEFRYIFDIKI